MELETSPASWYILYCNIVDFHPKAFAFEKIILSYAINIKFGGIENRMKIFKKKESVKSRERIHVEY